MIFLSKIIIKALIVSCLVLFFEQLCFSQSNRVYLKIFAKENISNVEYTLSDIKDFQDSLACANYLSDYQAKFFQKAFLSAGFDSIVISDSMVYAYFYKGQQYRWQSITLDADDSLANSYLKTEKENGRLITEQAFYNILEKVVVEYENMGYPFCSVRFDNIISESGSLSAELIVDKGNHINIDTIIIEGNSKVKQKFLCLYLGFKPGQVYREKYILQTQKLLGSITFIQMAKPMQIAFGANTADMVLSLNHRQTSTFSGIIGFLPDSDVTGKLLVTGDVDLFLENLAGRGEHLSINWTRYQALSQELKAGFYFPYFLNTRIGLLSSFAMQKQDTSYLNTSLRAGIRYLALADDGLQIYYDNISSFTLGTSFDSDFVEIHTQMLGVGLLKTNLDYKYNPLKGYILEAEISAGIKNIRNDEIESDTLQTRFSLNFSCYIPMARRITFRQSLIAKGMFGGDVYINELFNIGGLKTFRGFDENSLFASSFAVATSEIRFLFEKNSSVFLFCDYGFVNNPTLSNRAFSYPLGLGAGVNLQTKAGIFSLVYAYGKQQGTPFDLKSAKIHFGYISRF